MAVTDRRGATLIVVLGVLVLLSLIGSTFAVMMGVERSISRNYLEGVRAKLVAKSGLAEAVSRLRAGVESGVFLFPDQPGSLSWQYESELSPSFAVEDESPQNPFDYNDKPKTLMVNGKKVGFSGAHTSGSFGAWGDQYALNVRDLQGLIHVNDGVGENPKHGSVSKNLERILNRLGDVVGVAQLGTRIIAGRPAQGYRSRRELELVIGSHVEYVRFKDFVTLHAWQDSSVAQPVPLSADVIDEYPVRYFRGEGKETYRRGRGVDYQNKPVSQPLRFCPPAGPTDDSIAIWGIDELAPQWIEVATRAPININSAPREVILAMLADLRGFFQLGRRRNNPKTTYNMYETMQSGSTYSTSTVAPTNQYWGFGGMDQGVLARLYTTVPIVLSGNTMTSGISAEAIADELFACRLRAVSPHDPQFDYADADFGGPFRTWRQFEQFCDNLVSIGLLKDERDHYFDYSPLGGNGLGYGPLVSSQLQQEYAAQAIADVLKANFNPNLHLNEFNPDANLHRRVDKTDLIVASTEFCFTPMGFYEIECVGRVLRPIGSKSALTAIDNEIIAERTIHAVVQVFRAHRDTSQRDFFDGQATPVMQNIRTSRGRSLDIGPEPGPAGQDNEWGGFISFATVGGEVPGGSQSPSSPKSEWGEVIHAHFTNSHDPHWHAGGVMKEIASKSLSKENCLNFPDPGEKLRGPYGPATDHRLARSFRSANAPTVLTPKAPGDLRIDGAYIERHSAVAYMNGNKIMHPELMPVQGGKGGHGDPDAMDGAFQDEGEGKGGGDPTAGAKGAASYWFKPGYEPQLTGKIRMFLDISRFRTPGTMGAGQSLFDGFNPLPFFHIWIASHDTAPYTTPNEFQPVQYQQVTKPSSMIFGYDWGGVLTRTLNHVTHDHPGVGFQNRMAAHAWTHVAVEWSGTRRRLYVNGELLAEGKDGDGKGYYGGPPSNTEGYIAGHLGPTSSPGNVPWYNSPFGNVTNPIRVGVPSQLGGPPPGWQMKRNWSTDSTIDEFHFWKGIPLTQAHVGLWNYGRYVKPLKKNEGMFLSGPILPAVRKRSLAPPSTVQAPTPSPLTTVGTTVSAPVERGFRILGTAWTWMAEGADPKPFVLDYADSFPNHTRIYPKLTVTVILPGETVGPFTQDGYSPNPANGWFGWDEPIRYGVKFELPDVKSDTILLASPVLDDITIYYTTPESGIVSCSME